MFDPTWSPQYNVYVLENLCRGLFLRTLGYKLRTHINNQYWDHAIPQFYISSNQKKNYLYRLCGVVEVRLSRKKQCHSCPHTLSVCRNEFSLQVVSYRQHKVTLAWLPMALLLPLILRLLLLELNVLLWAYRTPVIVNRCLLRWVERQLLHTSVFRFDTSPSEILNCLEGCKRNTCPI